MESLSRNHDTYTGSYLAQRRRKRLTATLALVAILLAALAVGIRLSRSGWIAARSAARPVPKQKILADWGARKWDDVRASSLASLASLPLDSFYLTFKGFASFYKAVELPEGADRAALLDEAVTAIRKAIAAGGRMPLAQAQYVLGKAYYHKGRSWYDLAAASLEASLAGGYSGSDIREYLALAYAGLGDRQRALRDFDAAISSARALARSPGAAAGGAGTGGAGLLLLAGAKAYLDSGEASRAEELLQEALDAGTDAVVREKCRFLLGDIYRSRGDAARAEEQYSLVLDKNPDSAEAHYRLGLVHQQRGDSVRARAEWRKAVSIDPMHAAARLKLTEKL